MVLYEGAKYAPGHGSDVEHMGPHANARRGVGSAAEGSARMPAGVAMDDRHGGYGLPIPQDGSGVEVSVPTVQYLTHVDIFRFSQAFHPFLHERLL